MEFALVLPILIALILGILYFGRYENYSNQETQLAEMGVRSAALDVTPPSGTLQYYIQSQAQPELQAGSSDVAKAQVFLYYPTASHAVGDSVRACVVTTVSFPTPVVTIHPGPMAQSATMRIEVAQSSDKWTPDLATTAQAAGCP